MADDIVTRALHMAWLAPEGEPWANLMRAMVADIERLRAAGDAIAEWLCLDVAHYEECATMRSDWPEMCDCGADKLRRKWEEARRG